MRKIRASAIIISISVCLCSCASSIVDGEFVRTSSVNHAPKVKDAVIEIYLTGKSSKRETIEIGRVTSRSWVLEKGMNELKKQARELGADAIININYERKFSVDYLQDPVVSEFMSQKLD